MSRHRNPVHDGGLRLTQVRSAIGTKPKHRGTLRALGLRGIGQTNTLPDRPEIRGMIARVPHLITVEELAPGPAQASSREEKS
jgi:large subunit ribosomal protein L30